MTISGAKTSRREFLQLALAGSALVPLGALDRASPRIATPYAIYKVIFDERFPTSVSLARTLAPPGIPLQGISGDVTALWYHDLYFRWRTGPVQIAGVTTKESLFCLEILARDAGQCVTKRRVINRDLVSWSIGPRI